MNKEVCDLYVVSFARTDRSYVPGTIFGKEKLPFTAVVAEYCPEAECSVIVAADTGLLSLPRRSPFQEAEAAAASETASKASHTQLAVIALRKDIRGIISTQRREVGDPQPSMSAQTAPRRITLGSTDLLATPSLLSSGQ
jgi:hypothetical protein